jgi:hypothetical protein
MKYIFLVAAGLLSLETLAQDKVFSGKVLDKDKNGVPFCMVKAKDRPIGVYCDDFGKFSIEVNPDSVKAFEFSCLGYQKKEISLDKMGADAVIELQKTYTNLNSVLFKRRKGPLQTGILGKKKLKQVGDCYQKYGDEDAMYFRADPDEDGTLKQVHVFVTGEGQPTAKFRVHVYEKDTTTNLPSTELTDSNLIVQATAGNEWVVADLSDKNIAIREGVFISVEWISGFGNSLEAMQSLKHPDVKNHNGQVIGLALNYGVPYMYHRAGFHNEWGFSYADYLCPMIYCTYTYVK